MYQMLHTVILRWYADSVPAMSAYDMYCPIARALDVLGERWSLLILRELALGEQRFTDLKRSVVGIPPNVLSSRLKTLTEEGLVTTRELPPSWRPARPSRCRGSSTTAPSVAPRGAPSHCATSSGCSRSADTSWCSSRSWRVRVASSMPPATWSAARWAREK